MNLHLPSVTMVTLIGIGCTKNDSQNPSAHYRLATSSISIGGGSTTNATYHYGSDGKLTDVQYAASGQNYAGYFIYDYQGRLINIYTERVASISYFYDTSNRVIRDSLYALDVGVASWRDTDYTYNSTGQLTTSVVHTDFASCSCPQFEATNYTYPNTTTRNYSSTLTTNDSVAYTSPFEYDTHFISDEFTANVIASFSTDNYPSKSIVDAGVSTLEIPYTYQFDSRGNPTSITVAAIALVMTFSYTCG